jgi:hypothetical protein
MYTRVPGSEEDPHHFAQKAQRRARIALSYLVLIGIVLTLIVAAILW